MDNVETVVELDQVEPEQVQAPIAPKKRGKPVAALKALSDARARVAAKASLDGSQGVLQGIVASLPKVKRTRRTKAEMEAARGIKPVKEKAIKNRSRSLDDATVIAVNGEKSIEAETIEEQAEEIKELKALIEVLHQKVAASIQAPSTPTQDTATINVLSGLFTEAFKIVSGGKVLSIQGQELVTNGQAIITEIRALMQWEQTHRDNLTARLKYAEASLARITTTNGK